MKQLLITIGLLCCYWAASSQQQIFLDKPVRAGELTVFPGLSNPSEYYYLADKPQLATHKTGNPQFSFVRYVKNAEVSGKEDKGILESEEGGGIVHSLVELSVSDAQIRRAEASLQRLNSSAKIIGPVIFKSGTVALVTSVAKPDGGMAKQVVGLGAAPVLENQKCAVSVQLNKMGSKLLWEMFTQTTTPDFSFSFEMEVGGYMSPKNMTVEANFDRIYEHKAIDAAMVTPVLAAEVKAAFDDLYDSGAIKVTQIGEDEDLNKMKEAAYNQLISLMFDKIAGNGVPDLSQLNPGANTSMLDRATNMLDKARKEAKEENRRIEKLERDQAEKEREAKKNAQSRANEIRQSSGLEPMKFSDQKEASKEGEESDKIKLPEKQAVPGIAIGVSFTMKKVRRRGVYKINLNKYTEDSRTFRFDYNPGNIRKACSDCFLEINLDDPLMKQREILVTLGLRNNDDFKHVNFVNVVMKKEHQNGESTLDELRIDQKRFNTSANLSKMIYGWKSDNDRPKWLNYNYKIHWSFAGGHLVETDWKPTSSSAISLEPPVVRKPIYIEVDEDFVKKQKVRGIEVKLYSLLGEKTEVESVSMKTQKEELSRTVEILLPRNIEDYEYEVIYSIKGQNPKRSGKQSSDFGRIDVDRFL